MTAIRSVFIMALLVLSAGAFAGCVGGDGDETTPASTDDITGAGANTDSPLEIKVLAPLAATASFAGDKWVQTNTAVSFTATAPANAVGDLTYTWIAGPLAGTTAVEALGLNTGEIQPGESADLTFDTAGSYLMHCHPHPFMKSNVTVVEGYEGPASVEVLIVDGENLDDYRFVPQDIVIAPGTTVTYKNVGALMHTATQEAQDAPLKVVGSGASADVSLTHNGWNQVTAVMTDSEGRLGLATTQIYATDTLPTFDADPVTFTFSAGGAPEQVSAPQSKAFTLAHGGQLTVAFEAVDAAASGQSTAEVHVMAQGASQDTMTLEEAAADEGTATVNKGVYTVKVIPKKGVNYDVTITVSAVYDLVPPEPTQPSAGGHDDSGGGHQH